MALLLLIAVLSYIIGSIPFGLLIARSVAGVDLRKAGSGNIGATNVARVVGKGWGAVALLLDALKGALPTRLMTMFFIVPDGLQLHAAVIAGTSAVLGHMFSPWLGFRGGKGVATATGVVTVLAPGGFTVALATFLLLFAATRIVSIGSMAAAVSFAVAQHFFLQPHPWSAEKWSLSAFSVAVPALILWQHRGNIGRLLRGEEHAFRRQKDADLTTSPVAPDTTPPFDRQP